MGRRVLTSGFAALGRGYRFGPRHVTWAFCQSHASLPKTSSRASLIKCYKVFDRLRPHFSSREGETCRSPVEHDLDLGPLPRCWARHMAAASVCKQDQRHPFLVTERCCGNCTGRATQPRASCRWDRQLSCRLEPTETQRNREQRTAGISHKTIRYNQQRKRYAIDRWQRKEKKDK
jgi:hypothetical protein